MTESDASSLQALAEVLVANNTSGFQFTTSLEKDANGDFSVTVTNSRDGATDTLATAKEFADFFREKFWIKPVACYHYDWRRPQDDPNGPFLCTGCERKHHSIDVSATSESRADLVATTSTKGVADPA